MKKKQDTFTLKHYKNLHQVLRKTSGMYPEKAAFKILTENGFTKTITWGEYHEQVLQMSRSLIALGMEKGDKVAIFSYTCYEWVLTDMGITSVGASTVGVYQSTLPGDCDYLLNHSDSTLLFVENTELLEKILTIREKLLDVKKVILFHGDYHEDDWIMGFQEFLKLGDGIEDQRLEQALERVESRDPSAIVYTSGTTGKPKGAVLTHHNITFAAQSLQQCLEFDPEEEGFLFLPLAHIFARLSIYFCLHSGVCCVFARSIDTVPEDIRTVRPHFIPSVPRIFEKAYSKILQGVDKKGGLTVRLFQWACETGSMAVKLEMQKQAVPRMLKIKYSLARKLVFKKIQAAFGGRINWCICGGAPLDPEIKKFFYMAGIPILEGLGMTENVSFSNVGRLNDYRLNWIGPPGPGIEQKLSDGGEIYFKSENVMKEYYKMPEETRNALTPDGWLKTGDLGEIDSDGFLRLTGRKKDIIITSGGKNIAPVYIENLLNQSPYISQVCVVGDQRKFLTAVVVPDAESIRDDAVGKKIEFENGHDLVQKKAVKDLIHGEIAKANRLLPPFETIKRFTLAHEFTVENSLLTPTLKVRKKRVLETYKKEIDRMYDD